MFTDTRPRMDEPTSSLRCDLRLSRAPSQEHWPRERPAATRRYAPKRPVRKQPQPGIGDGWIPVSAWVGGRWGERRRREGATPLGRRGESPPNPPDRDEDEAHEGEAEHDPNRFSGEQAFQADAEPEQPHQEGTDRDGPSSLRIHRVRRHAPSIWFGVGMRRRHAVHLARSDASPAGLRNSLRAREPPLCHGRIVVQPVHPVDAIFEAPSQMRQRSREPALTQGVDDTALECPDGRFCAILSGIGSRPVKGEA
jgi:hypothetical protein